MASISPMSDKSLKPLHVLTSVRIVCHKHTSVTMPQHVPMSISAFLCPPLRERKTLEDAVAADNLHLLRRLLAEETADIEGLQNGQQRQQRQFAAGLKITSAARCAAAERSPDFRRLLECLRTVDPYAVGTSEVVAAAAAAHDMDLLEWLRVACTPLDADLVDSSAAAACAAGNGDIDVLEWLVANRWSPSSKVPVADAVANRQMQVLRWLENNGVRVRIGAGVIRKAAELGDLEMLEWLFARPRDASVTYAGDGAASGGHVHVLDWLLEHHPDEAQCFQGGYMHAAHNGHLDVLQWLYTHYPKRFWTKTTCAAAKRGNLAIIRFLFDQRGADDSLIAIGSTASASGNIETVKLVYELLADQNEDERHRLTFSAIQGAAVSGNLELIKWLHEEHDAMVGAPNVISLAITNGHCHVLEYITPFATIPIVWAIEVAAQDNRMDILQWLHAKISEPDSPLRGTGQGLERWMVSVNGPSLPVDNASYNGNLEIIEWLDANGYGECSTHAMDNAAEHGHLAAVQWLHEHRTEGCTVAAMNNAAANGHLEVVRWLHEHRHEGCTTDAVDLAVRNGHARVVEFLLQHRTEGCTDAVVRDAIEVRRDAELIHLLFTYRRELVDMERVRAHADANEAMQRWLRLVTASG